MPSLMKLIAVPVPRQVLKGEVVRRTDGNNYIVNIKGRELRVRPGFSENVPSGTRVIVSKTDDGYYLMNQEKQRAKQVVEVVIDG